jgi:hypothetical protein
MCRGASGERLGGESLKFKVAKKVRPSGVGHCGDLNFWTETWIMMCQWLGAVKRKKGLGASLCCRVRVMSCHVILYKHLDRREG